MKTKMFIKLCLIFVLFMNQFSFYLSNSDEEDKKRYRQSEKITENRVRCESNDTTKSFINSSLQVLNCPKAFDGILCWDETPANQWAEQPCPVWFIGFERSKETARRFCQPDGTWTMRRNTSYTDYTSCVEQSGDLPLKQHLTRIKLIAKIGSLISLGSLIIAMFLLIGFKRLHCARNILHCNLFASFLLFSVLNLIKETFWVNSIGFPKDLIIGNNTNIELNPNVTHWECKTLVAFLRYAESSNHVMIFSEGLYLNTLVSVSTFSETNHFKIYITLGWVGPLLWIIPYVIILTLYEDANSCWTSESSFSYLYLVPQALLIFLNFGLFVNIVRILKNKLRKNRLTESKQNRFKKLAKSTLILLPLFSIYYIAFSIWQPFVRGRLPLELELIRLYFEIICSSFQGLAISLIYGFFNSEVRNEVINQIERKLLQRYPNMRRFSTMIAKERNSCVSVGNDQRFRSSVRISEKKLKKLAKTHSVRNDFNDHSIDFTSEPGADLNNNNIIDPNRKKVSLVLKDDKIDHKNIFNIFKKRKKTSNSTISSHMLSSKGSKGTFHFDSIDIHHSVENPESVNLNSSLKSKINETNDKNLPKVSFAGLNEHDDQVEEQTILLDKENNVNQKN